MHMADALVSPVVGGTMWAATAGLTVYSARKVRASLDEHKVPLMGVMGAFVFAAQMINFTIPGTGSSGHLGGGLLLAILLGPHAAFLVIASVLFVQALFFADGGLLAYGCNVLNMGLFPCLIAYPLLYRRIVGSRPTPSRVMAGSLAGAVVGLQLGALGVVTETVLSGISALPFGTFVVLMLPIHLAIGVVEGLVTGALVQFVAQARPELLQAEAEGGGQRVPLRGVALALLAAAVVTGVALSWFASSWPDGLEWATSRTAGVEELEAPADGVHGSLAAVQERTAVLPDYGFRAGGSETTGGEAATEGAWPAVNAGTSVSGLVGGAITLALAGLVGVALRAGARRRKARAS